MLTKPGLSLLILCFLLALFSVMSDSPPAPVDNSAPDTVFSARRAYRYLEEITKAPHSCGTAENKRVREYIAGEWRQLGMNVEIQQSTAVNRRTNQIFAGGTIVVAANVYNVVARIKGTRGSGKHLLVMSHF